MNPSVFIQPTEPLDPTQNSDLRTEITTRLSGSSGKISTVRGSGCGNNKDLGCCNSVNSEPNVPIVEVNSECTTLIQPAD